MQQAEAAIEQHGLPADQMNEPRLDRLRLRLVLATLAILQIVLALLVFKVVLDARLGTSALGITVAMVFLTGVTFMLSARLVRQAVRPSRPLAVISTHVASSVEEAQADTLRDSLTHLGNHRAFQEELDRELEWYSRYNVPVSLLLLDVDDLKLVNASSGHAGGDEQLREMGRLIGTVTRYADRAFRIGGDEFAILMPHTDSEGAMQIGRRLLDQAMATRARARPIPFSGGIASCPEHSSNRTQLYAQAEAAMFWCKRHGRGAVDVFNPLRDQAASVEATNEVSTQIARIVNEHLVTPVYQPIVDLTTGRVIGFEGLSRPAPETGFTDPGTMFTAAEAAGRTVELDMACLQAVIAGAREMPAHQLLTINISPRTIEAPHFSTDALLSILNRYAIDPGRVVVELTEREKVEDIPRLQSTLNAMKRAGLRIAADDVGAGNAGLRLLSQFRFDIVKIDLSLVQDGAEHDTSRAVLRSLRDLAGRWGASVIAEGLETASQLRTVRDLAMTAGQGYLLARPMPRPILGDIDMEPLAMGGSILDRRLPQPRQAPEAIRTQGAY
ncbi:MAG TPA: bifunctional diguanylate cyclase/phosphodiesterase [Candidatus Limnocylindrales bacterium]